MSITRPIQRRFVLPDGRRLDMARRLRVFLAAMLAVFAVATLTHGFGPVRVGLVSNVLLISLPLTAALCCLVRATAEHGSRRRSWWLIGAAGLSWGLGQSVWTTYEQLLGRAVPVPSLADVGYLLAIPLLLLGLLQLPYAQLSVATRSRMVLDGLVIGGAILLISWPLALQPALDARGHDLVLDAITLAYPVGDSVAIILALVIVARARHGVEVRMLTLLCLAAGTVAVAVGDTGFLMQTQAGTYYSGHPVDLGWATGFALIGIAATIGGSNGTEPASGAADGGVETVRAERIGMFLPYLAVVVAVLVAIAAALIQLLESGTVSTLTVCLLLAELALLVTRQQLAMSENDSLTRSLEHRVAERTDQLASRERWFGSLVHNSFDVILVLTPAGIIDFQTPSAERILGYPLPELAGTPLSTIVVGEDAGRLDSALCELRSQPRATTTMDIAVRHRDGEKRDTQTTVTSLVDDPAVGGYVVTIRDVTDRRRLEQELTHQAFHDKLTGLANKALFCDRVARALAAGARSGETLAVVFIDLDDFKSVNDSLGHVRGDELLSQVAARLSSCVRPSDTVARFGGDEFAVLTESMASEDEAINVARRFRTCLQSPFSLGGRDVQVHASIGVAVSTSGQESVEELLRNADLAMYRAKSKGDGDYQLYEAAMHTSVLARLELEDDLRHALERGEFHLDYQPTVELMTERIAGVEALLRWVHPVRGHVAPMSFVGVAEEMGLIGEIGAWVIDEACRQAAIWQEAHGEPFDVAVNISGRQLTPELVPQVLGSLARHGVPPSTLTLEMTESVLISHNHDVVGLLGELRARGVRIAIDDFGTGYSSLSYLARLPVDILKLDRSFVEKVAAQTQEAELTRMIVSLAQTLGLATVAEGIEHDNQLAELLSMGCSHGQGYLFSRPVDADIVSAMLFVQAGAAVPLPMLSLTLAGRGATAGRRPVAVPVAAGRLLRAPLELAVTAAGGRRN